MFTDWSERRNFFVSENCCSFWCQSFLYVSPIGEVKEIPLNVFRQLAEGKA